MNRALRKASDPEQKRSSSVACLVRVRLRVRIRVRVRVRVRLRLRLRVRLRPCALEQRGVPAALIARPHTKVEDELVYPFLLRGRLGIGRTPPA